MDRPDEYMRGYRTCKDGRPHLINQTESYDQGFSDAYWMQEQLTGQQLERENERSRQAVRNTAKP